MERQKPTERKHILQNAQASPRKEPNPIAEGNIFKLRSHGSQDRTHDPQVEIRFSDQFIAEVIKRLLIEPHEIFLFKRKLYHPSAAHDGHDGELDEIRYGALCAVWMNIDIVGRRLPRSLALRAAREMLRTDSLSIEEWIKRNDAEQIWKVVHGLEHKTKELLPYYREVESAFGTDIADQTIDMAEAFKFLMKNIELRSNGFSEVVASYARLSDNHMADAKELQRLLDISGISNLPPEKQMKEIAEAIRGNPSKRKD